MDLAKLLEKGITPYFGQHRESFMEYVIETPVKPGDNMILVFTDGNNLYYEQVEVDKIDYGVQRLLKLTFFTEFNNLNLFYRTGHQVHGDYACLLVPTEEILSIFSGKTKVIIPKYTKGISLPKNKEELEELTKKYYSNQQI